MPANSSSLGSSGCWVPSARRRPASAAASPTGPTSARIRAAPSVTGTCIAAGLAQLAFEPQQLGRLLLEQGLGPLAQAPLLLAGGRANRQLVMFALQRRRAAVRLRRRGSAGLIALPAAPADRRARRAVADLLLRFGELLVRAARAAARRHADSRPPRSARRCAARARGSSSPRSASWRRNSATSALSVSTWWRSCSWTVTVCWTSSSSSAETASCATARSSSPSASSWMPHSTIASGW